MPTTTNRTRHKLQIIRGVTSIWFLIAGICVGKTDVLDGLLTLLGLIMIVVYWGLVWVGGPNEN